MNRPGSRNVAFALAIVVLVLDLASKQWVVTHLASAVHPLVAQASDAPTVQAALASHGVSSQELEEARTTGLLWRYRKAQDLKADRVLSHADADLDLVAVHGTGLAAPRRLRLQAHDAGKTLGAVAAAQWRVEPTDVQALLDQHVYRADGRLQETTGPIAEGTVVVLRERTIPLVDRFMSLVYAENFGAAWSFLATAPAMVRHLLFVLISLIASVAMSYTLWHGRMGSAWSTYALAAVLGGAIGNLVDRLRYHAVIDFIYNYVFVGGELHGWPVYNVADIGITAGVIAIALEMLWKPKPQKEPAVSA